MRVEGCAGRVDGSFGSAGKLRESEIENFDVTASGDKNVGGFDVTMDDAFCVGGIEGVGDFGGEGDELVEFDGTSGDGVLEGGAFEIFHGDESAAIFFADVINGADIRMIQGGSGFGFALETREGLGISGEFIGEKLQGDGSRRVSWAL